jgi:hypothetical protein
MAALLGLEILLPIFPAMPNADDQDALFVDQVDHEMRFVAMNPNWRR